MQPSPHSFHIPVMGLAFTIDSPIKVAQYGISSVISIIEDRLIEMMRKHYYPLINEPYRPIPVTENDYRAKRITDYLNLVNKIVQQQIEKFKTSAFETGSEIVKYFEMLPNESMLKQLYEQMLNVSDIAEKLSLQNLLKSKIIPGSIDVNIMTKVDKNNFNRKGEPIEDGSDALASLRGYANSELTNSSIVFSAGLNPRLFNYLEKLNSFDATDAGEFKKKVVVKVSDYRSALIQGKYLAKKGVWVSEFRIESGLNCGGHAFATDGFLLGPILEEFKTKRNELVTTLHEMYTAALRIKGKPVLDSPHPLRISVQGGIGTHKESELLRSYYQVDSNGWGTPFLLCPEATTVDDETIYRLAEAKKTNVSLSKNSPLGVRFHYLHNTSAEREKWERIKNGKPGSPCTEKHLVSNTEFTQEPICTASKKYQRLKIEQLKTLNLTEPEFAKQQNEVLAKECLCVGLSNSASINYNQRFVDKVKGVTICPGPNIVYFNNIVSLQQMTDHIYGKSNLLEGVVRPHMFINELHLYLEYLAEQVDEAIDEKSINYCIRFANNLLEGIKYYRSIRSIMDNDDGFPEQLNYYEQEIQKHLCRCAVEQN